MKKFVCLFVLLSLCVALFAGCGCRHEWMAATCTSPKTCNLCGLTEGESNGHIWEDATCIIPKKCSVCHTTEGAALSHNWEEATTEAPKTCTNCQVTEGTALQTDPRFTTASTKHLQGTWTCDMVITGDMLGIPDYFESFSYTMIYELGNTGEMSVSVEPEDYLAFLEELKRLTTYMFEESFKEQGIGASEIDAAMLEVYDMTMSEYVDYYVESMDKDEIFGEFLQDGVYYVGQNGLYLAQSWYDEFMCFEYTLEDDVLILTSEELEDVGGTLQWTRVK